MTNSLCLSTLRDLGWLSALGLLLRRCLSTWLTLEQAGHLTATHWGYWLGWIQYPGYQTDLCIVPYCYLYCKEAEILEAMFEMPAEQQVGEIEAEQQVRFSAHDNFRATEPPIPDTPIHTAYCDDSPCCPNAGALGSAGWREVAKCKIKEHYLAPWGVDYDADAGGRGQFGTPSFVRTRQRLLSLSGLAALIVS
jgi:hypothetical protein